MALRRERLHVTRVFNPCGVRSEQDRRDGRDLVAARRKHGLKTRVTMKLLSNQFPAGGSYAWDPFS